jgi:large subunit ribosomal protein L21
MVSDYAVIALGGRQYRVREGERLLVDRLAVDEGATFQPTVLAVGNAGGIRDGGRVEVTVEQHLLGPKIRILTYKPKKRQVKRRGHRSRLSRVRIESIGA